MFIYLFIYVCIFDTRMPQGNDTIVILDDNIPNDTIEILDSDSDSSLLEPVGEPTDRADSPLLIAPPTPSPPPRPSRESNSSSITSDSRDSSSSNRSKSKSVKRTSPTSGNSQEKSTKQLAREEAKRIKQHEQELQRLQTQAKKANALTKQYQNCVACIDKNILKIIEDPDELYIRTLFDENDINFDIKECTTDISNTITWTYKQTHVVDDRLEETFHTSPWTMVVIHGCDYLNKITTYRDNPKDPKSLKNYLSDILKKNERNSKSNLVLLVYNLSETLKVEKMKEKKNYQQQFRDCYKGNKDSTQQRPFPDCGSILAIGECELQDLRLTLEIDMKYNHPSWKFHIEFQEKTENAANSIVRYTRSIAKSAREEPDLSKMGIDWAISADKDRAIDPTKSTDDLKKLWVKQLQQFHDVTTPIANAIAEEYPSPLMLLDQYNSLTHDEAAGLLGEIHVQKRYKRLIGPSISRRIHCFLTGKNPDILIDDGSEFTQEAQSQNKSADD